jgi:hypothetical protein
MADLVDHADGNRGGDRDRDGPPPAGAGGGDAAEEMEITTNWDETTTTFDAMDLKEDLLRGIYAYGFEKPSAIQQRAVKPILIGRDVIAQAQSGAFVVLTCVVGAEAPPSPG